MQRQLSFLDVPTHNQHVWETLDHAQRAAVLQALAKLIAKTTAPTPNDEEQDDE